MDPVLQNLLAKHVKNTENEFKRIPKSNKHKGSLSEIQNMLENKKQFGERAEKIVNTEYNKMIDYINSNLSDTYNDKQLNQFQEIAKREFTEVLQKGFLNA